MQPESSENDASSSEDFEGKFVRANVDTNDDECFACRRKGKLNCCQTCARTFHQNCSKIVKNTNGKWQCPNCYSVRPCQFCGINAGSSEEIICTICSLSSHSRCLQEYHQAPSELVAAAFLKKSSYVCKDCLYKYGIRNITHITRTGKANNSATQEQMVSLVQVNYKSPIHYAFFREKELKQGFERFKQRLKQKNQGVNICNFKDFEDFYSHFTIQKLLEMKIPIKYEKYSIKDIKSIILDLERIKKLSFGSSDNFLFLVKWRNANYNYCTWEDEFVVDQLDPEFKCRATLLKFEQNICLQRVNMVSLMRENGIIWNQSISYTDVLKMAKYHSIYTIQVLEFNSLPKTIPFVCYFLTHNSIIEGSSQISILLVRGQSIQTWRKELMELSSLLEVVQLGGSEANINAIKMRELSNNSRAKMHVLLVSFETFQREKKFFASKMSEIGFFILDYHRISVQISHNFPAKNTILLANQPSFSGSKSDFLTEVRNSFKDSFIFRSDISWNNVEVIPPHDLIFNTLNPSNYPENIKYFRVYCVREEKRVAILRFILKFGLPISNLLDLYPLLRTFEPQVFTYSELSEQFKATFKGYMQSLLILLAIHTDVYLSPMIKQYYFLDIDPTRLQNRLIRIQKLRVFVEQGGYLLLPTSQLKDLNNAKIGDFTTWKEEDDIILIKLVLEYGYESWGTIFQCKNWSQYSTTSHNSLLSYLAYLKVKTILQFKANKADFNQFVESRMELIFNHL